MIGFPGFSRSPVKYVSNWSRNREKCDPTDVAVPERYIIIIIIIITSKLDNPLYNHISSLNPF